VCGAGMGQARPRPQRHGRTGGVKNRNDYSALPCVVDYALSNRSSTKLPPLAAATALAACPGRHYRPDDEVRPGQPVWACARTLAKIARSLLLLGVACRNGPRDPLGAPRPIKCPQRNAWQPEPSFTGPLRIAAACGGDGLLMNGKAARAGRKQPWLIRRRDRRRFWLRRLWDLDGKPMASEVEKLLPVTTAPNRLSCPDQWPHPVILPAAWKRLAGACRWPRLRGPGAGCGLLDPQGWKRVPWAPVSISLICVG